MVNMLGELYLADGKVRETRDLLLRTEISMRKTREAELEMEEESELGEEEREREREGGGEDVRLPLDLEAKMVISLLRLKNYAEAEVHKKFLLSSG